MNNANTDRLSDWRERYRAAGHRYNVSAHIAQIVRGIAWDRRVDGRLALEDGFLPVRTIEEHFSALVQRDVA